MAALLAIVASGCAQEEYPLALWDLQHPDGSVATSDAGLVEAAAALDRGPALCKQAQAQSYPARLSAIGAGPGTGAADGAAETGGPVGATYLEADLYQEYFVPNCGVCHGAVGGGLGGVSIQNAQDFHDQMSAKYLAHVTSDGPTTGDPTQDPNDPLDPMPPLPPFGTGKPFSTRTPEDPIWQFATLTQAWLTAGKPSSFIAMLESGSTNVDAGISAAAASAVPIPNAEIGNAMTNIGNCVPTPGLVGIEQTTSAALDQKFASAQAVPTASTAAEVIGLPLHLRDTDLFTLDSATLAQYGVIGYAPAYPLWSDNAAKIRYIRVPRGTSVQFDKASQNWKVPPNTRFYKTFMKQIVDVDGSVRYKKMETRLIVARPDQIAADGTRTPAALFGSYAWNDDESDAVLVTTPLKDGEPFADTVSEPIINEPVGAQVIASSSANSNTALSLLYAGAARHYAIPSSQRCMQCHMGSATGTFTLGFLPLQINRLPTGQSGIIEPAGPDELTQLQRFIDYGLITGVDSPADILPLEQSEGTRSPRNGYELTAQGYVFGNCSHCHNPNGYPSVIAPVLAGVLDFLPTPTSGIFQFPLDRMSPRIFRGATGQSQIPYITPSLMDLPRSTISGQPIADPFLLATMTYFEKAMFAPWRSLIYRNTDNPFAYTDDLALFPHMPMNTPGFDPRAHQILGEWMVSIPAIRKSPDIPEYAFFPSAGAAVFGGTTVDTNEQPYVEVVPSDPRYPGALAAAEARLKLFVNGIAPPEADAGSSEGGSREAGSSEGGPAEAGSGGQSLVPTGPNTSAYSRYADPGLTDDILDPQVLADPICTIVPIPSANPLQPYPDTAPVPNHCHWVITDTTQPPPPWTPRRPDWPAALASPNAASALAVDASAPVAMCGMAQQTAVNAQEDQATAVTLLQNLPPMAEATAYPAASTFLTQELPFGLWANTPGCDFSSTPKVSSFASNPPLWMKLTSPPADAPVYTQTPGEAVFKMICINCHGVKADSNGRLAQNLATMTGGLAEVADFRDGLFGPVGAAAGTRDIDRVFGPTGLAGPWVAPGLTADDRASRYMAWMALGGTKVQIPEGILQIVSLTKVLDQPRVATAGGQQLSANMLATAKGLCSALLGCNLFTGDMCSGLFDPSDPVAYSNTLIHSNGDAELWMRLCSFNNPPPVHIIGGNGKLTVAIPFEPTQNGEFVGVAGQLVSHSTYLNFSNPTPPVGGNAAQTLGTDNLWPWCVSNLATPPIPPGYPQCPPGLDTYENAFTADDAEQWAVRGAINAGLAVFTYVRSLETMNPPPDYNQCQQLP